MQKVLLVIGDAAEVFDTLYPLYRIREDGYQVLLAAPEKRVYHLVQHDKHPDWDITVESPGSAARALTAGALSSLSLRLPVREKVTGALNIYATMVQAFDEDAILVGKMFAGYAAVALANAHLYDTTADLAEHMRRAMEHRAVIEQAKGIIMGERRCTPDEAFAVLTKLSQDSNRKVRHIAAAVVARTQTTPQRTDPR